MTHERDFPRSVVSNGFNTKHSRPPVTVMVYTVTLAEEEKKVAFAREQELKIIPVASR